MVDTFISEMSSTSKILLSNQCDRLDLHKATFWLSLQSLSCAHCVSGFVLKISFLFARYYLTSFAEGETDNQPHIYSIWKSHNTDSDSESRMCLKWCSRLYRIVCFLSRKHIMLDVNETVWYSPSLFRGSGYHYFNK